MEIIAHAIEQVTQRAKCSNCGTVCQLQVEQWTNSLEIQQLQLPNLRCSHCGHPWNDLPGPYADVLRDAYWAPQHYWSTAGPAEKQNLAGGISLENQAELTGYLDDLQAALMLRYTRALDATSGSAFRAISSAADEEKFRTLEEHLRLWTAELLAMQRALISELEKVWHSYGISVPDRDWVPKATDIIWKPIENASVRWMIEALGVSADATIWLAPSWLFAGELQAARILNIDEWEATQNVLLSLCNLVQRKLSLQREEALNNARRKLRLRSRLPIGSPQPHHGGGAMPEKLTNKRDLSREFDQVNLTDRQRECLSLRLEYGLSVSEIAEKLGRNRTTIDEHLHAAKAKFERNKAKQRTDRNRAKRTAE
jgi:DNA-binding CsgD family transcriptional regulator